MTPHSVPPYALVLGDRSSRLVDRAGAPVAALPAAVMDAASREIARNTLVEILKPGDRVDLILASSHLEVQCQEVPFLSESEVRESGRRLASALSAGEACHGGAALMADEGADGGHVLWVGTFPTTELDAWIDLLQGLGASLLLATPQAHVVVRGLEASPDWSRDRLILGLDGPGGRVGFLRGAGLLFMRTFWLPEGMDAAVEEDQEAILEVVAEELARVIQFVKQKHRGARPGTLLLLGLDHVDPDRKEALARQLHMDVHLVPGGLRALVARALARHGEGHALLNLMPAEVLEARYRRLLRTAMWACAAGLAVLGVGAALGMGLAVARMEREAFRAEAAMAQRRALLQEKERVARIRYPALRVRMAEARQAQAAESLEHLGMRLLDPPEGVVLESVEIRQVPGEPLRWRFQVVGTSLSRAQFSLGPLGRYLSSLKAHPGLDLMPIHEVTVSDREGTLPGARQSAVARFSLEGVSP